MIREDHGILRIDWRRRLVPSALRSVYRDRALKWAHLMGTREGLQTSWRYGTPYVLFHRVANGEPVVYSEADLTDLSSINESLREIRLGKERMSVKKAWNRWGNESKNANKQTVLDKLNDEMRPEVLSLVKWRFAARDGGRKRRKQSHLVPINPLALGQSLRAGQ